VKNPSASVAFLVQARLTRDRDGDDVVPIFWDDNYFSLLPGEEKTISARYDTSDLEAKPPAVELGGYNVEIESVKVAH
jgi:exo-1,4-beta-D-glucosaminidase